MITLDAAYTDEAQLIRRIEDLFDAKVSHLVVTEVNLVLDQTIVDVRFRLSRRPRTAERVAAQAPGVAVVAVVAAPLFAATGAAAAGDSAMTRTYATAADLLTQLPPISLPALDPALPANRWNRTLRRYFDWQPRA